MNTLVRYRFTRDVQLQFRLSDNIVSIFKEKSRETRFAFENNSHNAVSISIRLGHRRSRFEKNCFKFGINKFARYYSPRDSHLSNSTSGIHSISIFPLQRVNVNHRRTFCNSIWYDCEFIKIRTLKYAKTWETIQENGKNNVVLQLFRI